MMQIIAQDFIDFDEFSNWYAQKPGNRYELHDGTIVEMPKPKGKHSQIAGFLMAELSWEIKQLNLPYFLPRECLIKGNNLSGYEPDAIVLDRNLVEDEPRWEKESTLVYGKSIKLVIEVISSNWSDDYALKLDAYETLGILEYWIVDYLGIGGRKFIGNPKRPTLTVNILENGEYQSKQFRENQLIESPCFAQLQLTASQVFKGQ